MNTVYRLQYFPGTVTIVSYISERWSGVQSVNISESENGEQNAPKRTEKEETDSKMRLKEQRKRYIDSLFPPT